MPLSKARNRQRMRIERKVAKMAHWGLAQKREEANDRLEKAISPPQGSKVVQPELDAGPYWGNDGGTEGIEPVPWDDMDGMDTCYYTKTQVEIVTTHYLVQELDADGNVIPDYE